MHHDPNPAKPEEPEPGPAPDIAETPEAAANDEDPKPQTPVVAEVRWQFPTDPPPV